MGEGGTSRSVLTEKFFSGKKPVIGTLPAENKMICTKRS